MNDLIYKDEVYEIIGLCIEVHNTLEKVIMKWFMEMH